MQHGMLACGAVMETQVALIVAFRPVKHSNTMVIDPAVIQLCSVGRCQALLEK